MGEKMETMKDFIFLGSKITVDGDCNCEVVDISPGNLDSSLSFILPGISYD